MTVTVGSHDRWLVAHLICLACVYAQDPNWESIVLRRRGPFFCQGAVRQAALFWRRILVWRTPRLCGCATRSLSGT